jgi:hypothetical protein
VFSPRPAFVTGPYSALDLMHVHRGQATCSAECREVGDESERATWSHEASVFAGGLPVFAAQVRPTPVADDSAVGYGYHVRVIEPARAAEFGKVRDRGRGLSARVDKAIVAFDVVAFAYAVLMRPSFV